MPCPAPLQDGTQDWGYVKVRLREPGLGPRRHALRRLAARDTHDPGRDSLTPVSLPVLDPFPTSLQPASHLDRWNEVSPGCAVKVVFRTNITHSHCPMPGAAWTTVLGGVWRKRLWLV